MTPVQTMLHHPPSYPRSSARDEEIVRIIAQALGDLGYRYFSSNNIMSSITKTKNERTMMILIMIICTVFL